MAEFAKLTLSDEPLPPTQLLVRGKDSIQIIVGPPSISKPLDLASPNTPVEIVASQLIKLQFADIFGDIKNLKICPIYSPNGSIVCFTYEGHRNIALYDPSTGQKISELPVPNAEKVSFSPLGTYLITWSRPPSAAQKSSSSGDISEGNLVVWDVKTGLAVASYSQKIYKPDLIQWTRGEEYCFRLVSNEIHIYRGQMIPCAAAAAVTAEGGGGGGASNAVGRAPVDIVDKVYHKGLTQFSITPTISPCITIAVFNREAGGNPARVTLYKYSPENAVDESVGSVNAKASSSSSSSSSSNSSEKSRVIGPVSSRTMFAATEARLAWNSLGTAVLIHAHSDVDASSYYGATGLFLMQAHAEVAIKVEQSKDGPVHDVQWSPIGDRFVVSAGTMPCHSTLFDSQGTPLYQYGAAHRNAIFWSPHGRFLCIAGFGNLAGEMDFYDTLRSKKIGSNTSHCSTYHAWSPDSRYFMTSSLAPRMNVDNNLKLFKYNGVGPVAQLPFDRAYDAIWRPAPSSTAYPNRGPSPKRESAAATSIPAVTIVKPGVYRPPGSSGSASNFMTKETVPIGKVPKPNTLTPTATAAATAKYVPKQRIIPGMPPPSTNATAGSGGKKNNNGGKPK